MIMWKKYFWYLYYHFISFVSTNYRVFNKIPILNYWFEVLFNLDESTKLYWHLCLSSTHSTFFSCIFSLALFKCVKYFWKLWDASNSNPFTKASTLWTIRRWLCTLIGFKSEKKMVKDKKKKIKKEKIILGEIR